MVDKNTAAELTEEEKAARLKEKTDRLDKAIALKEPDRVPFVPKIGSFFNYGYDISNYDAMIDARNLVPGVEGYMRDYDPDAVNVTRVYGIPILETLGTTYLRWPGPTWDLPLETHFQHLDAEFLHDDEYSEFLQDPTHFMITKVMPRKYKNLKGLEKLYLREMYDYSFNQDLGVFADPEVMDAFDRLRLTGKYINKRNEEQAEVVQAVIDNGYPTWCQGILVIPFDAFADSIRGILRTAMDCIEYPDELEAAVELVTEMNLARTLDGLKSRGAQRVFIPLHTGVDDFMSPESYERFYWPNLKRCIDEILARDMTPVCFCEGNYNSRLETIAQVPEGKVVYMFENVDLKRCKETVGQVACINGSVSNTLLYRSTPDKIREETKRQIDILAPGGGFIMDCSGMLDNANHENMRVWYETTMEYGKY